jgi:uncharacterized protein YbcV (DUF1398 family)
MFTIDQIKAAHSKVKSGADFPKYIKELHELGVTRYINYVSDGHTDYEGTNSMYGPPKYEGKLVAEKSDAGKLKAALKVHQSGRSDYSTFCSEAAEYGVNKWVVDIIEMTCTYFDKGNNPVVVEEIPG